MDPSVLFGKLGMPEREIATLLTNPRKCEVLKAVILESGISTDSPADPKICKLLLQFGLHKKIPDLPRRELISRAIVSGSIVRKVQCDAAVDYLLSCEESGGRVVFSELSFHESCGIGVSLTSDEIAAKVTTFFSSLENSEILRRPVPGVFVRRCKGSFPCLRWVDGSILIKTIEECLLAKLGVSSLSDLSSSGKKRRDSPSVSASGSGSASAAAAASESAEKQRNLISSMRFRVREIPAARNPPELLASHKAFLKSVNCQVLTRFPPEPNGYLHIGHARAMTFDFGVAREKGGECYLRYDDTNPSAESQEYIDAVREMVEWMGFKYWKITYTADYFDELHAFAIDLIKKGLAYVDFSSKKEIGEQRAEFRDSPYRNTSVDDNLRLFAEMGYGKYAEGECCLRCKIDAADLNPNMRDFVAFRVMYVPHERTGDKWCVYPTYDFSHCIVDSIENITHSMCTMEFETRRESYYWLLEVLGLYRPFVWEFSRLNVSTALLSKRKINKLVAQGLVRGFDDPRLLTLKGLRRRGYTPEIIKEFCLGLGASRSQAVVEIEKLEQVCRVNLDRMCRRAFGVLDPLRVVVTNMEVDAMIEVDAPNHPKDRSMGTRKLPLSKIVYIDRTDFRTEDHPNYFGLAPGKWVGLRYGPNIRCDSVTEDGVLMCTVDFEKAVKTKGHIHWVSPRPNQEPCRCTIRMLDHLLTGNLDKGVELMEILNPKSEVSFSNAILEEQFFRPENRKLLTRFQFERVGFFSVDQDSTDEVLVWNLIVPLKESRKRRELHE